MADTAELALDAQAQLGEGAIWHAQAQRLYWVDIVKGEVHIYDPHSGADWMIDVGQSVGTVVPRQKGGLMVAVKAGFASLDLESGALTVVASPEPDLPMNRFNDGKCDPAGRFWAGTMDTVNPVLPGAGSLYCLDADHKVRRAVSPVAISNGLAWSADKATFYFIDSLAQSVDAFDYDDETGEIRNRRTVISIAKETGLPDGMTIDAEGMLWVALWGTGRVGRWNPADGKLVQSVEVPASQTTACAFGGPNLDELYITSARVGLNAAALAGEPHAGGLFRARPGVRGVEAFEFAG